MKQILLDILRQLFGIQEPRAGKLVMTHRATTEMYQNGLNTEILKDVFRYGTETRPGLIVRKYAKYTVGLYYKYDIVEENYKITFVYKN
jgi:hypothetical protein